jgi:hypothetical protein
LLLAEAAAETMTAAAEAAAEIERLFLEELKFQLNLVQLSLLEVVVAVLKVVILKQLTDKIQ